MVATYAITVALIFVLLTAWILVKQLARQFARRHPEFGPYREKGACGSGGCGSEEGQGKCGGHSCSGKRG